MVKNFYEMNDYLGELLRRGQPASVIRLDNTAGYVMDCVVKNEPIAEQFFNPRTILEGGVYPNTIEYAVSVAYKNTYDCMTRADAIGFVDISNVIRNGSPLTVSLSEKALFYSDGYMVFDPGSILGYSKLYIENLQHPESFDPWTQYLKGKRVLVISTHAESIKQQWNKRHLVWGDKLEKIAPFDLVDVIRAPYHPAIDDRQYPNCNTWEDMVNHIKRLIESYDFDILLSGASTSSPMFVDHAKFLGKIGIQTGGVIQLYFGVMGGRWSKVPGYSDWLKMFNEHWIYPLQVDQAQRRDTVPGLESSFAYWG
jgi:hypothetical protein